MSKEAAAQESDAGVIRHHLVDAMHREEASTVAHPGHAVDHPAPARAHGCHAEGGCGGIGVRGLLPAMA